MIKKSIVCLGLISTIILGSIYIVAGKNKNKDKDKMNNDIKKNNKLITSIQRDFDKGNLTETEIETKYPGIFEIVTLSGQAFHYKFQMDVDYAEITILERNCKPPVITDSEGRWTMKILKLCGKKEECSFVLKHPFFPESQTGVIDVYDSDISDITFQMPDNETFFGLKAELEAGISQMIGAPYSIDVENSCQIFTTLGKSWASMLYDKFPHGEPDATAIISPAIDFPSIGPIYFDEDVVPDPALSKTSVDGGVFYSNVPTGNFTIEGNKENVLFESVKIKARPGIVINASPPYGVQGNQE